MTLALNINHLLNSIDPQVHREEIVALRNQHPSDIAEALEESDAQPSQLVEILSQIGNHKAVEAFAQLSIEMQQTCLEEGNAQTMLRFVENMEPDDRVDLLKAVDDDVREAIMPLIAQAERNAIRKLWQYEEGTAGAVMTTEYAMLAQNLTVSTALEKLRLQAPNKETIYYIYITDSERHLLGIISLRDLIMSKPSAGLDAIMETNLISVPHEMDIEKVAGVFSKYDLLAVPVVDKDKRLLGIITVDDVIDIIEAESTEDFQRISAVLPFDEEYFKRPLPRLFWSRFIWLAVLLFTSLLSTTIMEWNAAVLNQMMSLAFFIPMVMGTCGNAGTQSATMIVRGMALGEISLKDMGRVFRRELVMGLLLGGALGSMAYFRVFLQDQDIMLACIVAAALLATLLAANLLGALMPLALKKLKLDPALTAGPFIATIMDALGIAIYFQIAFSLMAIF
ncbi:MAG: magnesium transporter [Desulfobacteraceae bacterium]|nr:MAG: magnesium transporter [Desulfobacteraceae bacterium]